MHNIKTNFDKFYQIVKNVFSDKINEDGNFYFYPHKPKMNDCSIIALSVVSESIGIDSENYLWGKIKKDHAADFPKLIDRSNFNRRRKRLSPFILLLAQRKAAGLTQGENVFLMDSMPVPVCKIAREKRCKFGGGSFESKPDKGYSAVTKQYYYGYKLHLITSASGIFHSMDLTKASVHDVNVLKELKYGKMHNATLIGDKGYISREVKIDLFTSCNIKLENPTRANQKQGEPWSPVFRKSRKRIETLFSQLCDQMMMTRNYAKKLNGLTARLISKITAVTILQTINYENKKPINHLKHALAA